MHIRRPFRFAGRMLVRALDEFHKDNCLQLAAAISYYVLFSLFPLIIILLAVTGIILQNTELQNSLINAVVRSIPMSGPPEENTVVIAIRQVTENSGTISLVGLLILSWSSSKVFAAIRQALNTAYNLDRRRTFLRQKLIDFAMVAAIGFFLILSVLSTTLVATIQEIGTRWDFLSTLPLARTIAGGMGFVWELLYLAVPFVMTFASFAALYWIVPAVRIRLRHALAGALVASILFELSKMGFVIYLNRFARFSIIFGSLGAVVAFLFWVYLSAIVFLFGAELASELAQSHQRDLENEGSGGKMIHTDEDVGRRVVSKR